MTVAAPAVWPRLEDVVDPIRTIVQTHRSGHLPCAQGRGRRQPRIRARRSRSRCAASGRRFGSSSPSRSPGCSSTCPGFETVEIGGAPLGDTVFTFDCATLGRFGERRAEVERASTVVNIDHHLSNTAFGTINLVDATASATGQVIYGLLRELGAPIGPAVATNLYAALFTDTGGFRHENTTEASLRLAAALVAAGADPGWVALKSYKSRSLAQVRLEGLAIAQMHSEMNGRLLWSEVTIAMLEQAGADMQDAEGIIDALQSIAYHGGRDPLQGAHAPTAARSACAPASPSTPPRSARRSEVEATGAPPAPSSGIRCPIAERRVLEVARRLIDPRR